MKELEFEWLVGGRPDGVLRKAGDRVKMSEAQAKYHLQAGHLKPVGSPVKKASKPVRKPEPKSAKPRAKTGEPETAEDPATKTEGDETEA